MDEQKTVLLVEDNIHLNKINGRALELAGYRVLTAVSIAQARTRIASEEPDAIILDILLPDGSGVDFCREIREHTAAPILFLTSVAGVEQALAGLRAGGDDYLNKPFHIELLLARIEAFWRRDAIRQKKMSQDTITRGPLTLDLVGGAAFIRSADMLLTAKEFAVLLLLVQNEGKTLTKDTIYERVWGQPMGGDSQALYTVMSRLKKKLEPAGELIRLTARRPGNYLLSIVNNRK